MLQPLWLKMLVFSAALMNPAALWGYNAMPRIGMRAGRLHGSWRDAGLGKCGLCEACPFTSPPFAEALFWDVLRRFF